MSTRRALFFSFVDRYSGLVLSVISSMVIARLLKPEEIGVFSVAMALLAFAATLRDMGAGQYVVQAQEVTGELLKAVWTIQFSLGTALGLLVAALAYPVAAFYNEPRIAPIMGVMALTYFVTPVGSITYALLMREMRFQHVAVMRFTSSVVGSIVAIGLAYQGFGPISLAWSLLAASITTALVAQFYRQRGQHWGLSFTGARKVLGFGGRITATSFINTLVQGMPDFALGKLQGMTAAGLYSRSNGLVAMFNRLLVDAVSTVAVPHFAKGQREDADLKADFLKAVHCLVTLNVVFALGLVAFADPLTRLLYGEEWGDSVQLTRWLALAATLLAAQPVCVALLLGTGRADLQLKATGVSAALQVLVVLAGASVDLEAMGVALSTASGCSAVVWLLAARKVCGYQWADLSRVVASGTNTAVVACLPMLPLVWYFGWAPQNPAYCIALATPLCGLSLIGSLLLTRHPLAHELTLLWGRLPRLRWTS